MANFAQASRLLHQGELKRAYWICGPDAVLREEILDLVRKLVKPAPTEDHRLVAGEQKDKEIWAHANQYPLDPLTKRLVTIRDAHRIKNWSPLSDWLDSRHIPQVHLVLMTNQPDFATSDKDGKPIEHMAKMARTGRIVRCTGLSPEDMQAWAHTIVPWVAPDVLAHASEVLGGDTGRIRGLLQKCAILGIEPSLKAVDTLCQPSPAEDLVHQLTCMKKAKALSVAELVDTTQLGSAIGLLDYQLDLLETIHRAAVRGQSPREMVTTLKVPGFLLKELIPAAKHYDKDRVRQCRAALTLASQAQRSGENVGVLEALIAAW